MAIAPIKRQNAVIGQLNKSKSVIANKLNANAYRSTDGLVYEFWIGVLAFNFDVNSDQVLVAQKRTSRLRLESVIHRLS